mmetsp:Transcript_5810/g.19779  ORF Transcript_5810/g.19779 Transcript_5810/m.19779 type:complete len:360 (-) Transcript_5810:2457-3536(-)
MFAEGIDVCAHCAGEKKRVLRDHRHRLAKFLEPNSADVNSINRDRPGLKLNHSKQREEKRRLSAASPTANPNLLPWLNGKGEFFQHLFRVVAVSHIDGRNFQPALLRPATLHAALCGRGQSSLRWDVKIFDDALNRVHLCLDNRCHFRHEFQIAGHVQRIHKCKAGDTRRNIAGNREEGTQAKDENGDAIEAGREPLRTKLLRRKCSRVVLDEPVVDTDEEGLTPVSPDCGNAVQTLVEVAVNWGPSDSLQSLKFARGGEEVLLNGYVQNPDGRDSEHKPDGYRRDHDQRRDDVENRAGKLNQRHRNTGVNLLSVLRESVEDPTARSGVEKGHAKPNNVTDQVVMQAMARTDVERVENE